MGRRTFRRRPSAKNESPMRLRKTYIGAGEETAISVPEQARPERKRKVIAILDRYTRAVIYRDEKTKTLRCSNNRMPGRREPGRREPGRRGPDRRGPDRREPGRRGPDRRVPGRREVTRGYGHYSSSRIAGTSGRDIHFRGLRGAIRLSTPPDRLVAQEWREVGASGRIF